MWEQAFDCHVHTIRSACGEDITDEWLGEQATRNGYAFAVTDHAMHLYYDPAHAWAMMSEEGIALFHACRERGRMRLAAYVEALRRLAAPQLLVGLELDVLPNGEIMFEDDMRPQFDLLVGAVHYLPSIRQALPPSEIIAEFQQQTRWLCEYGIDILAHPFRILLAANVPVEEELIFWLVEEAARFGVALEINSHKPFPEHDRRMAELALARGVRLACGTDAHNRREFGVFDYHAKILEAVGIRPRQEDAILFTPKCTHRARSSDYA